jgi:hypothetical protein
MEITASLSVIVYPSAIITSYESASSQSISERTINGLNQYPASADFPFTRALRSPFTTAAQTVGLAALSILKNVTCTGKHTFRNRSLPFKQAIF